MSCGGCPPPPADTSCGGNQNNTQGRSRYTSDTESNFGESCYTSDLPSGEECICDQENMDDCCGPPSSSCGGNTTCGGGGSSRNNSQANNQSRGMSQQYSSQNQQRRLSGTNGAGQNRMSGQRGYMNSTPNRLSGQGSSLNGATSEPKKSSCACGPPQSGNSSSVRQSFMDSKRKNSKDYNVTSGFTPNAYNGSSSEQRSWGQDQRVSINQQQAGMRGSQQKTNSSSSPTQPKQIIAPCCFQNKSSMSLTDKTSQRTVSPATSKASGCPCFDYPKPTEELGDFVCPSCAEFEQSPEPPTPLSGCTPAPPCPSTPQRSVAPPCSIPPPRSEPTCDMEPEPEPDCEEDKPKTKTSGGHGFWQQLQFQVLQQQDGDEDEGGEASQDPCLCEGSQASGALDKPKKSGKVWQQLTLDIFQSKDDDGSDGEADTKQGWQQQLKLQIFQEKFGGDDEPQADSEPVEDDCDECTC